MPSKKNTGRIVKAKHRGSTPHQKNHRWETFTAKISRFNALQPLRKVRRHDLDSEDLSTATSYFQTGLQKWGEANASKGFASFKRQVYPMCETLAQILHFEDRIMALLAEHISMQEKEALEPLLDLLTAFAHDLGSRFEKYYGQSLNLIVALAGRPQDVEVIEWTFTALAFLFKYLSKLLVPNLRPTFDVVAPLMGKSRHPPHIARFAAESLSFLVKKAGAPSHRETALPLFIQHVKSDLLSMYEDRQFLLYKDGVMTMFAEAIKGNDHTIHSAGTEIFTALMNAISEGSQETDQELSESQRGIWTDVVSGVLTSAIHHSTVETFGDMIEAVLDKASSKVASVREQDQGPWWQLQPYVRLLGVIAGVRRGTRVKDWPILIQGLVNLLEQAAKGKEEVTGVDQSAIWYHMIFPIAVVWHHAPMDALTPNSSLLIQSLVKGPLMRWFLPFAYLTSQLDPNRFKNLLRAEFEKFIAQHWSDETSQDLLCIMIPKMIEEMAFSSPGSKDGCKLAQGWQDQIVLKFEDLEVWPFPERGPYNIDAQEWKDRCLPKYSAFLDLAVSARIHPSTSSRIAELLLRKLKLALRPSSTLASDEVHFLVSQGFDSYLKLVGEGVPLETGLSPLLRAAVPRFARSIGFLEAYLKYETQCKSVASVPQHEDSGSDSSTQEDDRAITSLVENLSSPSHEIRLASLKLLQRLTDLRGKASECCELMVEVEQLPLGLEHARTIAMLLRNLAQHYSSLDDSTWLQKGVPGFAFGMLNVKLAPIWDDATEALKQIAQTKAGEEAVSSLAFQWLDVPSPRWTPSSIETDGRPQVVTDFDCTWLRQLQGMAEKQYRLTEQPDKVLNQKFVERQQTTDAFGLHARSRALKVLNAVPSLAEKRSRYLVPHLLPWTLEDSTELLEDNEAQESYWSMADRKALLGVFSHFVNPRVLYLHEKVYDALLSLLENGDVEVQKLALKAILAWKQAGVRAYQENLEFLLDDARFKNELTVFLQGEDVIKPEHRGELMPVLLRLLYGRTISKKGAASGKQGLQATRLAVIRNLSVEDLGGFLDISMGKLKTVRVIGTTVSKDRVFEQAVVHPRKQLGFLNMTLSLISELGSNVPVYMERLLHPILYCVVFACRRMDAISADPEDEELEKDEEPSVQSLLRVIRSTGIKCLNLLFQNAQEFQWSPYHGLLIGEIIAPRLDKLPMETTQGVSGIMKLFATWSVLPRSALLLGPHEDMLPQGILPKLIDCLVVEKTKPDVKIFVLGIVRNLVNLALAPAQESEFNELIKAELLDPNADHVLQAITDIVQAPSTGNDLLEACVEAMLSLAQALEEAQTVASVLQICIYLLKQPPRRVSPKTKARVLLVVENFIKMLDVPQHPALYDELYETLASLFSYFKDRESRLGLCRSLHAVSVHEPTKAVVAQLCSDLNSFKEGRIEQPDYDRRLAAFNAVSRGSHEPLTPQLWLPLLHNFIFFIRADEEFGVLSTNSADGLRKLVQDTVDCPSEVTRARFEGYLTGVLMPAIYAGAREPSETVRREYLRVLGFILTKMPVWEPVKDLCGLREDLHEESAEPAFFFNILSPAVARQMEALQMLEAANLKSEIGSQNLTQFFIPLLEHFIFGREDGSDDRGLGAQANSVIGALALSLHWKHYKTTLQRYIGYVGSKPEQQKRTIRLLGKFTDALVSACEPVAADDVDMEQDRAPQPSERRLALTMPKLDQRSTEIGDIFLPPLVKHLHEKDESEVSYRAPVGITVVKLLKLLPSDQTNQKLAGVLTDICHILRSKTWEAREMARETLVEIAKVLGPTYFGFILKELRGALTRGYQLHVLSYTMHSILVAVVPGFVPGDLDYCLPSIVTVIMDDIFGVTGQEKDAEGYISEMKEVKSSKSQDSMELIAKNATIGHLIALVKPLQALLMQKIDLKIIRKIDALMSRISAGLLQNPAAESRDTLVFCYEVVQEVYRSKEPEYEEKLDPRVRRYLVQKGAKKSAERGRTTKNTHKLLRFAIDILRAMFKRHDSLRTPENLTGFLPILGDAILGVEDEVKISTFRLLAVIVKVPFEEQSGVDIFKVALKEATKSVSQSVSTTTELSQAALKMLSVVLRDRKDVAVKDAAVDMLLGKLKDDLTEPQYRHVTFNFVRSVLERQVETATVYDTMDYIGSVMITEGRGPSQ
jgi:U3 small nucleolar RNA-associated protein 20